MSDLSDIRLGLLLPMLDMIVFERLADSSFAQQSSSPNWFIQVAAATSTSGPFTLTDTFPFLHGFLTQAGPYWRDHEEGVLRSDPFIAEARGEEYLLAALAFSIGNRRLLVIQRLSGLADPRPLLQKARELQLTRDYEVQRAPKVRAALSTLSQSVNQLLATELAPTQRGHAESIQRDLERLRALTEATRPGASE